MSRQLRESPDTYSIRGYEIVVKTVARSGRAGRIYLPVKWVDKTVKVVRVD
jgi:hypothetical protein